MKTARAPYLGSLRLLGAARSGCCAIRRERGRGAAWLVRRCGFPRVIAWLLGAYLRTRRLFVAALRDRADRAESEREILAENAVVQERARIARELHDIVAHSVSVMVVQAEAADEMLDRQRSDRARIPISKIQDTGRSALTDMRRMLGVLREADSLAGPSAGDSESRSVARRGSRVGPASGVGSVRGAHAALPRNRVVRVSDRAGGTNQRPQVCRPGPRTGLCAVWPNLLELEVCDDGVGQTAVSTGGHGLVGMRERVALFGGELEAGVYRRVRRSRPAADR